MIICAHCGVIAPERASSCDACKEPLPPLPERRSVPPRGDRHYWIQVRAQFTCTGCNKRSPVNHVDVDGEFTCLRCKNDQAADAGVWQLGLKFCHEVVDLAGPDPEGRHPNPERPIGDDNKWADIGVTRSRANLSFQETTMSARGTRTRSLFLHARPGVPLCPGCREPFDVNVERPAMLVAACTACDTAARYEVDDKARHGVKGFMGALADDHRADRPTAKLKATAPEAPVAIECPGCGAALSPEARDHFHTCAFCGTASKIPSGLRAQLFETDVSPEPFWLLFVGPSKARAKLEKKAAKAKAQADRAEAKALAAERQAEAEEQRRATQVRQAQARQQRTIVALVIVVAVIVGVIVFGR